MNRLASSARRNFLKALAGAGIVAAVNPIREFAASQSSALLSGKMPIVLFVNQYSAIPKAIMIGEEKSRNGWDGPDC
jgi:hypothetical protein